LGGGVTVVAASYAKFIMNENADVLMTPTLGASAAIFGVILVFGVLFPNLEFTFFPIPIPIKAEYLTIISVMIGVFLTFFFDVPISNEGHIGGAVFGGIYYLLFLRNVHKKVKVDYLV
jgi:membrane associated rhomboid family serine protease